MRNTKVYSILEHFDKYEQNRLRKYLQSPYFNKNETLVDLFELIVKHINSGLELDWSKEKVWKKLVPGTSYDDVRFRKYLSDLLKLVEGFLAQQIYEDNPLHLATYLIEAVGKKNIGKLYNSTMKTARRLSKQQKYRPASYYYYQYQVEKNYYELTGFDIKRTQTTNETAIIQNLDYFYLAEKLRLYCSVQSRQYLISSKSELLFIDEIIKHIERYNFEEIPAITIYYQIYLTQLPDGDHSPFFKLRELLRKHYQLFSPNQAYDMYSYAMNYCIRQANKGNQKFLEELFDIYKEVIDNEIIILADEGLSPWKFKNIIVAALRLGKYDWTKSFIGNYQQFLPIHFRENAVTYNLAQLYFYQKKYDKVIEKLRDVEFDDFSYNLNSKTMLVATYYEMDEIEPLYSLMDSFRTFLNRRKDFPEERRQLYTNLIRFTKKLTKLAPNDHATLSKIKKEVNATKNIASVNWLREKIAELEE